MSIGIGATLGAYEITALLVLNWEPPTAHHALAASAGTVLLPSRLLRLSSERDRRSPQRFV
jgi:hypothetical protein